MSKTERHPRAAGPESRKTAKVLTAVTLLSASLGMSVAVLADNEADDGPDVTRGDQLRPASRQNKVESTQLKVESRQNKARSVQNKANSRQYKVETPRVFNTPSPQNTADSPQKKFK